MAVTISEMSLGRACWLTNTFCFLYSTAKASLYPFLPVYLRYLGIPAIQTGIVFGIRACLTVWCGAVWTNCAKKFNKQRAVLMFSLYCVMGVFLGLTFVPPADRYTGLKYCYKSRVDGWNLSSLHKDLFTVNTSQSSYFGFSQTKINTSPTSSPMMAKLTMLPSVKNQGSQSSSSSFVDIKTSSVNIVRTTKGPVNTVTETISYNQRTLRMTHATTSHPGTLTKQAQQHKDTHKKSTKKTNLSPTKATHKPNALDILSKDEIKLLQDLGLSMDDIENMSTDELEQYLLDALNQLKNGRVKRDETDKGQGHTTPRSIETWQKFKAMIDKIRAKIVSQGNKTFIMVLILVIIAGLLASPVDRLVDNCWFEFLDNMDCVEKYGEHALWGTIGSVFAPTLITTVIDHVPCVLPFHLYNFVIHVFVFCVFCAFVFILALFFPISTVCKKPRMKLLVAKGIRTVCNNAHASALTVTMYLVGLTQASSFIFLFWKIQDLKGGEMPMGISVTAAALVEVIMYFFNKGIVRKLGHGGGVVLALVIMSGRILFYSFLPSPWLAVAGEAFYGFSNSVLWHSVHSFPDFRLNALVTDRSAANTIHNIYHAFGFGTGCIISGVVTSYFGMDRLFQGAAGLLFVWAIILIIILKCIPKKQNVKYRMLLQGDANDDDDSSDDDWLEVALKEVK